MADPSAGERPATYDEAVLQAAHSVEWAQGLGGPEELERHLEKAKDIARQVLDAIDFRGLLQERDELREEFKIAWRALQRIHGGGSGAWAKEQAREAKQAIYDRRRASQEEE